MNAEERPAEHKQELFYDVIRRTFEKGTTNEEMTIQKLIDDLIIDLKTIAE